MHFVNPDEPTKAKWDELLRSQNALLFSYFWYLDATGCSWKLLVNDDFSGGMACPYVTKLGQQILVTPFFVRYVQWVGEGYDKAKLLKLLHAEFPVADLQVLLPDFEQTKKHQFLEPGEIQLNSQAKRTLKKAQSFEIDWNLDLDSLKNIINQELNQRIPGIDAYSLSLLFNLVETAPKNVLKPVNCRNGEMFLGGLWLLEDENRVIYLKGTSDEAGKKSGVMYRLMFEAINYAEKSGKLFDFGGSNAESVARFNTNFGAKNAFYSQLTWNNAPFWWKIVRNLKNSLKNTWKRK